MPHAVLRWLPFLLACALLPALGCSSDAGEDAGSTGVTCDGPRGPLQPGEEYTASACESCVCLADGELRCDDTCDDAESDVAAESDADAPPDAAPSDATASDSGTAPDGAAALDPSCVDTDLDGFFACDEGATAVPATQDCDDTSFTAQPGGYEFPTNRRDDDCDGTVDEPYACGCTLGSIGGTDAMLPAIDLCDGTVRASSLVGQPAQFRVVGDYFTNVTPRLGSCMVVMSSGDANEQPVVPSLFSTDGVQPGDAFGPDSPVTDPDPSGGDGGGVYDLAQWVIEFDVPANVQGFTFDFMFLSAEFPEYLCQSYNDTFYALLNTDAVNGGATTNVSFDANNREVTVNVGYFEKPTEWTVDLSTTPFGVQDTVTGGCPFLGGTAPGCTLPEYCDEDAALEFVGSGSGWLRTAAPVTPGQGSARIVFSIHDEGDASLDSLVLIDNFAWTQGRPEVGTVKQ